MAFGAASFHSIAPPHRDNADLPETHLQRPTAGRLVSRYEQPQRTVEANELVVFRSACNALGDLKNARKDEGALCAGVGEKFGLTEAGVQAIYRLNEADSGSAAEARGDRNRAHSIRSGASKARSACRGPWGASPTGHGSCAWYRPSPRRW